MKSNRAERNMPRLSGALGVTLAALAVLLALRLIMLSLALDPLGVEIFGAFAFVFLPFLALRRNGEMLPKISLRRDLAVISCLIGLLAAIMAAWLLSVVNGLLTTWFGSLPPSLTTEWGKAAIVLVDGVFLPLGQGILFWLFLQQGVERAGRLRGAWWTAFLFAGATVVISVAGISAGVAALPLAVGAAMLVYISGNGWAGVLSTVVYGLAGLLLPPVLLDLLGINALSLDWAALLLLCGFGIAVLLQAARFRLETPEDWPADSRERLWRQPLLWLYAALVIAFVLLELFLRSRPET